MSIKVAEHFYSLQGEGYYTGRPAVFLRLTGCNLLCKGKWVCDSIKVWKKGKTHTIEDLILLFREKGYLHNLVNGAHLVITGGEPLLWQNQLIELINFLPECFVEIETNGTIVPRPELNDLVDFYNVSIKLSNSGEPYSKRVKEEAVDYFNNQFFSRYKIVITDEDDLLEVLEIKIDMSKVWLMPAGATKQELDKTRKVVAELCKKYYLPMSDRLHINIWNKKTGV